MTVQEQLNEKQGIKPLTIEQQQVSLLREAVARNPVFSAVMHKFALRERARAQVTLHSLVQTMHNEGFEHSRQEYVEVLKLLGKLSFGRMEYDAKKRLIALKDIKVSLQSIGMAAVSKSNKLSKVRFQNRFKKLNSATAEVLQETPKETPIMPPVMRDDVKAVNIRYPAKLTVQFSKDEIETFDLPGGLSPKEVGLMLQSAYAKTMSISRKK